MKGNPIVAGLATVLTFVVLDQMGGLEIAAIGAIIVLLIVMFGGI